MKIDHPSIDNQDAAVLVGIVLFLLIVIPLIGILSGDSWAFRVHGIGR